MGQVKEQMMEQQEQERNFKMEEVEHEQLQKESAEEHSSTPSAGDKEPECRFGHICTSSCGNDYDCPCQSDHCCDMTEDCEGSTDPDDDHCESCMERTLSNLKDANK